MKVYTKTGDLGTTSLLSGTRVPKNHIRIVAYGTIDEALSHMGDMYSFIPNNEMFSMIKKEIEVVMRYCFYCQTDFASDVLSIPFKTKAEHVSFLENAIDFYISKLPKQDHFILPTGQVLSAKAHICRSVIRRAEISVVSLIETEEYNMHAYFFLNRLSDYFFVLAKYINFLTNTKEIQV